MDGSADEMVFQINGSTPSKIHFVAQRTDLVPISLGKTEVAIVTNDPNFRTCLFVNSEQVIEGATLSAKIITRNTSISAWMLDIIATKLNNIDPEEIGDLEDLSTTSKDNLVNAINETNSNIGELPKLTTTEKSNTVEAINEVKALVSGITTGGETNTENIEINRTNIEVVTARVTTAENNITVLDDTTGDQRHDINTNAEAIGTLTDLKTQTKDNLVNAINDIQLRIENGTLVDKDGSSYERVKIEGPVKLRPYSNIVTKTYGDGTVIITGSYTEYNIQDLLPNSIKSTIMIYPDDDLLSVEYIRFYEEDTNFSFEVKAKRNKETNNLTLAYRNLTENEVIINGKELLFKLKGRK